MTNDFGKILWVKMMEEIDNGRHYRHNIKPTTNDFLSIDIRRLHKDGLLAPGQSFTWNWTINNKVTASIKISVKDNRIVLSYRHQISNNDYSDKQYLVNLNWTSCNYGNKRPWFICPAEGCGRRIAVLYGGSIFACRHCYQLAYQSQREDLYGRATRKADIIRKKLGWELGILNAKGTKPVGMHWKTYNSLMLEYQTHVNKALSRFEFLRY